jgi:hypothetical protein
MVRDIRELTDSPEAYAAELRRRWGGLLSYRYIGRSYASMDLGPEDNTVTLRRDMRNPTGGLLLAVLGIASPEGGHMSDLEAVPNPVIHSCQILDPGRDVRRVEIVSEELKRGGFSEGAAGPTAIGRCPNWRSRSPHPTPPCTSARSSSSSKRPLSNVRPASPAPIRFRVSRHTSCSWPAARSVRSASRSNRWPAPTEQSRSVRSCTTRAPKSV